MARTNLHAVPNATSYVAQMLSLDRINAQG